jgi:small-conductance mechanosensitive channel
MDAIDTVGSDAVLRLILLALAFLAFGMAWRWLTRRLTRRITDRRARYRLRAAIQLGGYALGAVWLALLASNEQAYLPLALGIVSAAIAFALQDLILSIAGWLTIYFAGIYRAGDRIEIVGVKGDVIAINMLQTTLMEIGEWVNADLYTGRIVRLGNNHIFKGPVINYTSDFPFLWDEITIPVHFKSDLEAARAILAEAADRVVGEFTRSAAAEWQEFTLKYEVEDARTEPLVTMVATDNYVLFTLRYVVHYRQRRSTADALFRQIDQDIAKSDNVQLASATIEIVRSNP